MTPRPNVLDWQALDDAAAAQVRGLSVDLGDVRARAEARRRTAFWRNPRTLVPFVAACVAAVAVLVLLAVPSLQTARPAPATPPSGPATIPATIGEAPSWTPSVTARPIGRALYLVSSVDLGNGIPQTPWLVGADRHEFRTLPATGEVTATALSADGRLVAWTDGGDTTHALALHVLDVSTGRSVDTFVRSENGLDVDVRGLAFSPDGGHLLVTGTRQVGAAARVEPVVMLGNVTPRQVAAFPICSCVGGAAWDVTDGRIFVDGDTATVRAAQSAVGSAFRVSPLPAPDSVRPGSLGGPFPSGAAALPLVRAGVQHGLLTDELPQRPAQWAVDGSRDDGAVVQASYAVGLAVTSAGARVASSWTSQAQDNSKGGGEVVAVSLGGAGAGLVTRLDGQRTRVIALAAGLFDGATRPGTAVRAPWPVLDVDWWPWAAQAVVSWLRANLWLPIGAALVVAFVLPLVRPRRSRLGALYRAVGRAEPALIAVVALLAAGALALVVVPTAAPTVPAPTVPAPKTSGTDRFVVPRVIQDQRLVPARAFDTVGAPRTTRLSLLWNGPIAGRPGSYGLDAATGAWVRLDDLPGVTGTFGGVMNQLAVSPDGRWLTSGYTLVDLQTASVLRLPGKVDPFQGGRGGYAVLNDGRVVVVRPGSPLVTWTPPSRSPLVEGAVTGPTQLSLPEKLSSVRALSDGLLALSGWDGSQSQSVVGLLDPVQADRGGLLRVPGADDESVVASVVTGVGVRPLLPSATSGRIEVGGLPVLDVAGAVKAVDLVPGRVSTVVVARTADRFTLELGRGPLDLEAAVSGAAPAPLSAVSTVGLGLGLGLSADRLAAELHLAANVLATATPVDGSPGPWWAPLALSDDGRSRAQFVLVLAGFALFWLVLWRFAVRRG